MYQFIRIVNDVGFVSTGFRFPLGFYNLFLSLYPIIQPLILCGWANCTQNGNSHDFEGLGITLRMMLSRPLDNEIPNLSL